MLQVLQSPTKEILGSAIELNSHLLMIKIGNWQIELHPTFSYFLASSFFLFTRQQVLQILLFLQLFYLPYYQWF